MQLPISILLAASLALAGEKPAKTSKDEAPPGDLISGVTVYGSSATPVEGVDVIDRKRCRTPPPSPSSVDAQVVGTYPKYGELVPSGLLLLRITFDQPMSPCTFAMLASGRKAWTFIATPAMMTPDRRSFLFVVSLVGGEDYTLTINEPHSRRFRSASGGYGLTSDLFFRTSIQKRSNSLAESARRDPFFETMNSMPGRVAMLGVPRRNPDPRPPRTDH